MTRVETTNHRRIASKLDLGRFVISPWVSTVARQFNTQRLRILAFHGVPDLDDFERLLRTVVATYSPVSGDQVEMALNDTSDLPRNPVWLTFDDGLATTFAASEVLARYGVTATAFVNPKSILEPSLLWFQVLDECDSRGLIKEHERERFSGRRLKSVRDNVRQLEIQELAVRLAEEPDVPRTLSATPGEVARWLADGHEVGNHTWDHPCLDRCDPKEQSAQVRQAHQALVSMGVRPRFFAYPNGNWSSATDQVVHEMGYSAALLFDHQLANTERPRALSRLRISSSADDNRVGAILSGAHSGLFTVARRVRLR